jgi:flagellar biosynthetic protein FliQ
VDQGTLIEIGNQAMLLIVYIAAPLLLSALAVGLIISVFQAATQIQEQTLSFIPKLIALVVALALFGPWMLQLWISYTQDLYLRIPQYIN